MSDQYADVETGTNYNYFRDCYDPATGRYCQSDPMGFAGGSYSTYAYVGGNPLTRSDPFGLSDKQYFDPTPGSKDYNEGFSVPAAAWNVPGYYTVSGHGNPTNMEDHSDGHVRVIWPKTLAEEIRKDPKWNHRPVILGACNTGKHWPANLPYANDPEFGRDLAKLLGVTVIAPAGFARYLPDGTVVSTPEYNGPTGQPGPWRAYDANGNDIPTPWPAQPIPKPVQQPEPFNPWQWGL